MPAKLVYLLGYISENLAGSSITKHMTQLFVKCLA